MSFGTWTDYYTSIDEWLNANIASLDMTNILNHSSSNEYMRNLVEENNLVTMKIDSITGNPLLFYHLTRIGNTLKKKSAKMIEKVIALNSFGASASVFKFKLANDLFDPHYVISADVSSPDALEQFEHSADFSILTAKLGNAKPFRNVILLSLFAAAAILSTTNRSAPKLA